MNMALDLTAVNNSLASGVASMEADLNTKITAAGDDATPAELLQMQQAMQKWQMANNLQSNTIKAIGEAMKSTISNLR